MSVAHQAGPHTAHIEALTAEVRVLMVGSRQVTLSVVRQLDHQDPHLIEPFGRIRAMRNPGKYDLEVIGRDQNGTLCKSQILMRHRQCDRSSHGYSIVGYEDGMQVMSVKCAKRPYHDRHRWDQYLTDESTVYGNEDSAKTSEGLKKTYMCWQALPLIVLAGLR